MTPRYLLLIFVVCSHGICCMGEEFADLKQPIDSRCYSNKTVTFTEEDVKEYKKEERKISAYEEDITLFFKPDNDFRGIKFVLLSTFGCSSEVNFTKEELEIVQVSQWLSLSVTFYYKYFLLNWHWYIRVSITEGKPMEKYVAWVTLGSYLTTMKVIAMGPSEWRFAQPDANCSNQEKQNPNSNYLYILGVVPCAILLIFIPIVITMANKAKQQEVIVLPRVNLETENENEYQLPLNATGDGCLVTRPGSAHDSENSLYGVL